MDESTTSTTCPSSSSRIVDATASHLSVPIAGACGAVDTVGSRSSLLKLVPLVPVHEMLPGTIDVSMDRSQLVYLAPLTSVKKEIHREKRSKKPRAAGALKRLGASGDNAIESITDVRTLMASSTGAASPTKRLLLASLDRPMQLPLHKPHAAGGLTTVATTTTTPPSWREEDEQLARLKQKVRLLPISDSDRDDFWRSMRAYQQLQLQYHQSILHNQSTPMGFNMEAAWNRTLYEARHQQWTETHENRIVQTKERKAIEDDVFARKVFESTTEYRAQLRVLREVRARLSADAQAVLPTVMLSAFTQRLLARLQAHWTAQRLQMRLRGAVRFWREQRAARGVNAFAANILVRWLQKSVAVKSVAFKVFRGIRTFVRRVKKLQCLWRVKAAKRERAFRLLQRLWLEYETQLVDAAAERHDRRLLKSEQVPTRKSKTPTSKKRAKPDPTDFWLTLVDASIRTDVIRQYLHTAEIEFVDRFRQQEAELFPQLVQTLRCEQPNRARSYVKVVASNLALLGRVHTTLQQFPGAVDGVAAIAPVDNDVRARRELLNANSSDDEYKKQLAALLERRRHLRATAPPHPGDAIPALDVTAPSAAVAPASASSQPVDHTALADNEVPTVTPEAMDRHVEALDRATVRSRLSNSPHDAPLLQTRVAHSRAHALVVVTWSFRHLPSLSEAIKDVAAQLSHALVDTRFSGFATRGSRLLVNPSVIEFQDTMNELARVCEPDSSFFLCLSSHGARVTRGTNEGSYVLFSESRLSSEDELLLTAVHERELARLVDAIPSRNKLVALELCHVEEPTTPPPGVASSIRARVHDEFARRLHTALLELEQQRDTGIPKTSGSDRRNQLLVLEACSVAAAEIALRCNDDGASLFLHRVNDAFRGAAVKPDLDCETDNDRRPLQALEVVAYICSAVRRDAALHNARVKSEFEQQVHTRLERAAAFHDITQTPHVVGHDVDTVDFALGVVPAPPTLAPTAPLLVDATRHSLTVAWTYKTADANNTDAPVVLGFHVQYCGSGRACTNWRRASSFQVLSYDVAVRDKQAPPTSVAVFGFASDVGFCFRVRARTAGGWGPFSAASDVMRTRAYATVQNQYTTVQHAVVSGGAHGLLLLMRRHATVRALQRQCVDEFAKLALQRTQLLPTRDMLIVHQVGTAMQTFRCDYVLQRHASLFVGRLCASSEDWRRVIRAYKDPDVVALVHAAAQRFESVDAATFATASWASARIRGDAMCVHYKLHADAAVIRIQSLYRTRKARECVRALAQAVYQHAVDPHTGKPYVYNTRTGVTSWSLPAFVS